MRLSTESARDDGRALETLMAALGAGVRTFDTARAYGLDQGDVGHNERLLARALAGRAELGARVITKCGMTRDGGAWLPDGRARTILADAAASVVALAGVPIDLLLLHAPDPRVSIATSARALARVQERGIARRVGVCNVSRKQLEAALAEAPIAAVEVALGAYDDLPIRSGVLALCIERGIELLAHAPLGGPERARKLAHDPELVRIAQSVAVVSPAGQSAHAKQPWVEAAGGAGASPGERVLGAGGLQSAHAKQPWVEAAGGAGASPGERVLGAGGLQSDEPVNATPLEVFLAYLLSVSPAIRPVVGARRVETVRSLARAERLALSEEQLAALDARFPSLASVRRPAVMQVAAAEREVVLLMGVPGSGKSRAAQAYVERGYERLNRDLQGGSLKMLARVLDERLAAGAARVVLDNTYVTRASRYEVVRVAAAHGAKLRCVHLETPLAQAQINVILRMIERFGRVIEPEEIDKLARSDAAAIAPHALFRLQRELEPPAADEGFATVQRVPFVREQHDSTAPGVCVALSALGQVAADGGRLLELLRETPSEVPVLVYGWQPDAAPAALQTLRAALEAAGQAAGRHIEVAFCTHPAGRPICWCRPPLPALLLSFAHRHQLSLQASTLIGTSTTDSNLARALDMSFRAD